MKVYILNKKVYLESNRVNNTATTKGSIEPIYVDYMEEPITIKDYIEKHKDENLEVVDAFEMEKLYKEYQEKASKDFTEITEERFDEMLNVLPPQRWTRTENYEYFFISEAYSADLHSCFARLGDKYYEALLNIRSTKDEIIAKLLTIK